MSQFDFRPAGLFALDHLRHGRLWLGLGVALIGLVLVGSLVSMPKEVGGVTLHDKVLHIVVYGTLMAWFAQLFRHDLTRLSIGIGFVVLGIAIEFLQGMVPTRQFEIVDMVANTSGVLLAWALSYTRVGNLLPEVERLVTRSLTRA